MQKDLFTLDNEPNDDDFDKMLQEFIDEEFNSDDDNLEDDDDLDDADTDEDDGDDQSSDGEPPSLETSDVFANDDEEILLRVGGERNYMPEITKVEIEVQPLIPGSLYINGQVVVTIHGKEDSSFADDRFQLNIFGEGDYPMANTKRYAKRDHPSPTAITTTMLSRQVWLPGRYTLYVRDGSDDSLVRMPFTLDAELKATVGKAEPCIICSTDDILTSQVDGECHDWEVMALYCSTEAMDALARALFEGWQRGVLSIWSLADIRQFVTEQVKPRYLARCYREIESDNLPNVEIDDLCFDQITSTEATTEQCFDDLDKMVGLDDVKKGIRQMADNTKFYAERRRRGLPTSQEAAFHCVFTGNPGTGKTTVAKKLGRIYRSLGLLSRGEVIAVDRTRLVGRYIGETEENMKAILDEARGNVLFIDEAYTLYDGASDRKDFGARVIDSLLTVLSQPNPDMLVIFAGYLKEMDAMLSTNQGLMGRFPYKYQFEDYNADQLYAIACSLLKRDAYILSPDADTQLRESVAKAYAQRDEHFSNARWVEQFVNNGIIPAMASRISRTACDDYQTIEVTDVCQAYTKFNPRATALRPRHKVGFSA